LASSRKIAAPAKEAAAKGAWKAVKRGMSLAIALRRPTRCRLASACRVQTQITPHPQERIA